MSARTVELLDTTLRDGSYVIDFQFTAEDTALLVSTLDSAGVRLIEIGHGLGLGAARAGKGNQADSDERYLQAAAAVTKSARIGAFFIPGIGTEDDVRLAADHGADFIRIGTNVTELDQAGPSIALAKKLGLQVFSNLMKSYAVSPAEFGALGKKAENLGADVLCLVDSAGGMLPEDVRAYLEAAREHCTLPLAFHGHNNLSMAVANSIEAFETGATILDASLQGMGRSEGNAITEILVAILQKRGQLEHIDVNSLLDISEAFVRPLLHNVGYSGLGITSGRAKFHSSFTERVLRAAAEYGIDPRDLILGLADTDLVDASEDLVTEVARRVAEEGASGSLRVDIASPEQVSGKPFIDEVAERAGELRQHARKLAIPSVLNIVVSPHEPTHVSPYVETRFGCALANVMLEEATRLPEVIGVVDGMVDYVLLDPGRRVNQPVRLKTTTLLLYSDAEMWSRAIVSHILHLFDNDLQGKTLVWYGDAMGPFVPLLNAGARIATEKSPTPSVGEDIETGRHDNICFGLTDEMAPEADAVIAYAHRIPCVDADVVEKLKSGALLFDAGIGSLSEDALATAEARKIRVVRIDLRPTLAAVALEHIGMERIVSEDMGRDTWNGVSVIAGGLLGRAGEVVVDSISRPTRVIGVADGKGGINGFEPSDGAIQAVRRAIADKRLGKKS